MNDVTPEALPETTKPASAGRAVPRMWLQRDHVASIRELLWNHGFFGWEVRYKDGGKELIAPHCEVRLGNLPGRHGDGLLERPITPQASDVGKNSATATPDSSSKASTGAPPSGKSSVEARHSILAAQTRATVPFWRKISKVFIRRQPASAVNHPQSSTKAGFDSARHTRSFGPGAPTEAEREKCRDWEGGPR
ncbi:hypothetical protein OpiT1DRAFT_03989 [Opitutaceae bacterium TAV1]|nr:hypothetical protein OpiT1DRAFT_03989 [Opitutaceae bacterium TAV1]